MKIAKIVKSNSHIDYVGRILDSLDVSQPPDTEDYGFGQFLSLPFASDKSLIGVIYNSILINPEYSNFGPRLSSKSELRAFSPDFLDEQGQLIGILVLGSLENGVGKQGVPRRMLQCGLEVVKTSDELVRKFHTDQTGVLQIHYYPQIIAHAGSFAIPLIEAIVENLSIDATLEDKNRLKVLKNALSWQRTVGGMRL